MAAIFDPERCRVCGKRARVIRSVRCDGYRRRRHQCQTCLGADGEPRWWDTYQSRLNPRRAIEKIRAREEGVQLSSSPAAPDVAPPTAPVRTVRLSHRRAKASDYLSR